jgi:hypothetical protein
MTYKSMNQINQVYRLKKTNFVAYFYDLFPDKLQNTNYGIAFNQLVVII